jgi:hypothetical protein
MMTTKGHFEISGHCRHGNALEQQKRKQMAQPLVESFFLKIEMKH